MALLEISLPHVDIEMIYATSANITGRPIYANAVCLLHADAAAALSKAAQLAAGQGCRLREAFPDPEFIADPRDGSNHARGVAVDLTLADADGAPLDMGTPFDDLTAFSHHGDTSIPAGAQANRSQLLGIMAAAGWHHYPSEWWHYQLPDPKRYPLLWDAAAGGRIL